MRYLTIFLLLTIFNLSVHAQSYSTNFLKKDILVESIPLGLNRKSSVNFGFKTGASFSNMNFNKGYPAPPESVTASWKTGFVAGFLMEVPVYSNFFIQPEYLYSYIRGENKIDKAAYKMSYLSLPVLFKYRLAEKFAVMAGPQFDLLIEASKNANGINSNITHDTEERSIAATAALEFKLIDFLSLDARYIHGFNHIGIGQRSDVKEFKFEMAQLTAVLKF